MSSSFDHKALQFGEPVTSGKGAKSVGVTSNGKPIVWQPDAQEIAFEPGSFSGEEVSRVNLVMRASALALQELYALDEYIVELASLESTKLFGKSITKEEVRLRYSPCLKVSEKYPSTFKAKMNMSGRSEVRIWNEEKQPRKEPVSWVNCTVVPKLTFKGLWLMSKEFGCLFEATDLMLTEASVECPF